MPIFDQVTGDEVLFLCYSCDRYHKRLSTTSRHWRISHPAANLFDPSQVIRVTRPNLELFGVAAIRANPPPPPQFFQNRAGIPVDAHEHPSRRRLVSSHSSPESSSESSSESSPEPSPSIATMTNSPESSPEPTASINMITDSSDLSPVSTASVTTTRNPPTTSSRTILPAHRVGGRRGKPKRVTKPKQPKTKGFRNQEYSSSSSSDSDDDDDEEVVPPPQVLRGAPIGKITPINESPAIFRNEIMDQWYQDPYQRPTGQGPAGDLLRHHTLVTELKSRGLSVRRAKETADYLVKCGGRIKTEEEVKSMSRAARSAATKAKKEAVVAAARAALSPPGTQTQSPDVEEEEDEEEDDDEEEEEEEEEEDDESVITSTPTSTPAAATMAPPSLSAHVPFTASVEEASGLTDAELDRRMAACRGSLRRYELVYGEGGLEDPEDEDEGEEEETLWRVELEDGREVITGDVTFGLGARE